METKQSLENFDPNSPGNPEGNIFGLPFTVQSANLIILPVPWDVTVSYNKGTAKGPKAIFDASFQVDLFDPLVPNAWKLGLAMDEIDMKIWKKSKELRKEAEKYIDYLTLGGNTNENKSMKKTLQNINQGTEWLHARIKKRAGKLLKAGKKVALIGGDHSTPLGLMQALSELFPSFGILQIDAHTDLRKAYEGFTYSHASIMYNAVGIQSVDKLVQVGIRDYCEDEIMEIRHNKKIVTFFDRDLKHRQFQGETWMNIAQEIVNQLPEYVYISFDIDGLDPKYCPNTGTPVPGGLEFEQCFFLFELLVKSGRKIISFDINEVSPGKNDDWDANVGARLLYRLSNLMMYSLQGQNV